MKTETLNIQGTCEITVTHWENIPSEVTIDYTEHQGDGYYSDTETSCDIDKAKAIEIIAFLTKHLAL